MRIGKYKAFCRTCNQVSGVSQFFGFWSYDCCGTHLHPRTVQQMLENRHIQEQRYLLRRFGNGKET